MQYSFINNAVIVKDIKNFSLSQTLECGQCFRFNKIKEDSFSIIAFEKELLAEQKDNDLILSGISMDEFDKIFKDYFDLTNDYTYIKNKVSAMSPLMQKACDYAYGIRILQQEPFEILCSFILSQNNNIPRIKGIINKLCNTFGKHISNSNYSFPKPETIACLKEEDLLVIKSGFRARYLIDAAKKIDSGVVDLNLINSLTTPEAKNMLMNINGVGPKIADCVLLYGFHRLEVFPVDVWIKRAMNTTFTGITAKQFGKYAGVAQQYIYHYSRTGLK